MQRYSHLAPKPNPKTLTFAKYAGGLPEPPAKVYREYKVPPDLWGMFGNDSVGDCTCAAIAHMLMLMTSHTGTMLIPSVKDILAAYSAITGYDPSQTDASGNNPTDQGAVITDVLNYWQTTGIAGHKILGWASVDPTNTVQLKQALWLFGSLDIGITVYQSMEDQFDAGQAWDNPSGEDLGDHSIPLFGYGADGTTGVTWAKLQQMGWLDFPKYCSEAYAVISPDWMDQATKLSPSGLDLDTLWTDLKAI